MSIDVLAAVSQAMPDLRPSERRVAVQVLKHPAAVVDMRITDLARKADTSVATIVRFCKAVGYSGYPELRRELASTRGRAEVALAEFGVSDAEIEPQDSLRDVVAKIALHEQQAIRSTAAGLDLAALDSVAGLVIDADRIDIFGSASSSLAGTDLQQKLHRIGTVAFAYSDVHLALTGAALSSRDSLTVCFSHSGLTLEAAAVLERAKSSGATTVAITNSTRSPVAAKADHVLATSTVETRFRPGAMSSRIAQLAVVDFLFVRVVQRRFGTALPSLQLTYEAIRGHRYPAK